MKILVYLELYSTIVTMLKEILILLFCANLVSSHNNTRVERSDKITGTKIAIAHGLAKLGQVAYNQLSGK
jgi:hypothetical protein